MKNTLKESKVCGSIILDANFPPLIDVGEIELSIERETYSAKESFKVEKMDIYYDSKKEIPLWNEKDKDEFVLGLHRICATRGI